MSGLWARYNKLLDAQPILTKALTSLTGFTLGDILAQKFINDNGKPYDIMRTVRLGSFGFFLHGPKASAQMSKQNRTAHHIISQSTGQHTQNVLNTVQVQAKARLLSGIELLAEACLLNYANQAIGYR
jgi:hypothetical protein